jgi:hypothetical protein
MNDLELRELSSTGVYVAGFTNPDIKTNTQYYDVLIDGKSSNYLNIK